MHHAASTRPWRFLCVPAVIMLALLAVALAPRAAAETASVCSAEFAVLRADTETVVITTRNVDRDRAGLLKLVGDAQDLASIGKTGDAITKLRNFQVKVDQLQSAGRISVDDAARLRSEAEATISCLQGQT